MNTRHILTGVLAGVAMFVWSSIAHMVLPLGEAGVSEIPNEPPVLTALQSSIASRPGLYIYPGMGGNRDMQEYGKKLAVQPSGLLIYHPPGAKAMEASQLAIEFLTEVAEALLLVFVISLAHVSGFGGKVGLAGLLGVLAAIATNIPYWNWYGFPATYTASYMFMQVVSFLCAGLVAAAMLREPAGGKPA